MNGHTNGGSSPDSPRASDPAFEAKKTDSSRGLGARLLCWWSGAPREMIEARGSPSSVEGSSVRNISSITVATGPRALPRLSAHARDLLPLMQTRGRQNSRSPDKAANGNHRPLPELARNPTRTEHEPRSITGHHPNPHETRPEPNTNLDARRRHQ